MSGYPKIVVSPLGPKAADFVKKDARFISPQYMRYWRYIRKIGVRNRLV
jgi:hypothetical protein